MKISSLSNPKIKQAVKLRDRKERSRCGLTLTDGAREVLCALRSRAQITQAYVCLDLLKHHGGEEILGSLRGRDVPIIEVSREVYQKLSFGDRKDGIVAVCSPRPWTLAELSDLVDPFFVVIERVEKPGNLGAILRTCDGAGVDALLVSDQVTDIFNPNVIRASLGTVFTMPVVQACEQEILSFLKQKQAAVLAATPAAPTLYTEEPFSLPVAVVLGSEQRGLSDFWLGHCDRQVKIPMRGQADSLNVSISAAILIYEVLRQTHDGSKR